MIQTILLQFGVTLITMCAFHRLRIASRRRTGWRRAVWSECGYVVATGNQGGRYHSATCALPAGHSGDHAVTLVSLELAGYSCPPF